MRVNYKDLLKDQVAYIAITVVVIAVAIFGSLALFFNCVNAINSYSQQSQKLKKLTTEKQQVELQVQQKEQMRINNPLSKNIIELKGQNFGVDASFAPLFDNLITLAKVSGIRIRSVDYNFSPEKDPIFAAKLPGYNVCELKTTIVGNYSQVQAFLKNILAQSYLVNLAKVEIISWKRDQSVLIANLRIRFYTNTP